MGVISKYSKERLSTPVLQTAPGRPSTQLFWRPPQPPLPHHRPVGVSKLKDRSD